jgi:hypothetical protein
MIIGRMPSSMLCMHACGIYSRATLSLNIIGLEDTNGNEKGRIYQMGGVKTMGKEQRKG